jgi:hypothetical protein
MKRFLFLPLSIALLASCKKIQVSTNNIPLYSNPVSPYRIEDFRKPGMDDYQTIMAACDSLPENSTIVFDPKMYVISHTPIILKTFHFKGPATLKREDQIVYTLQEPADENSTSIILNNTDGIIPGDRFYICLGQIYTKTTSNWNVVLAIKGDTLTLVQPLGRTVDNLNGTYLAGTDFFKNINFFWVLSATSYPNQSCSFTDLIFDGNRDNNKGSYSWTLNAAVTALTKGTTQYRSCKFINSPGETIVGHNADVQNCFFYNLNGSAIHTSADKVNCTEDEIHSYISDNTFENTNQVSTTIGGHSEGAITHSNSGGYYTATRNTFINVGESVLGALYPSNSMNDWGTSNISFTGNTINGASRMVYLIDTSRAGTIHNVRIDSNAISNMPSLDWTQELKFWPDIILKDKSGE